MHDEQEQSQTPRFLSLTWRWVAWILGTCGILYLGTLVYSHSLSEDMIIRSAEREAVNAARAWINEVEEVLRSLEESTRLLGDALGSLDLSDEDLERLLRAFVAGNPKIYGSTAAFVPFGFRPSIERFSPYYHREGEEIVFADLADDSYRYWEWDKERLESELEIARKIQMDMLPEGEIGGGEDDGFELSAKLVPARHGGATFITTSWRMAGFISLSVMFRAKVCRPLSSWRGPKPFSRPSRCVKTMWERP